MEAARLVKVADRLDLGTDALRGLAGTEGKIPKGNSDVGPMPTPAPYSGTKLPTDQTAARFSADEGASSNFDTDSRSTGKAPTQDARELNSPMLRADFNTTDAGAGKLYAKSVSSVAPQPDPAGGDFEPRG